VYKFDVEDDGTVTTAPMTSAVKAAPAVTERSTADILASIGLVSA